jgi:hypothetical protein
MYHRHSLVRGYDKKGSGLYYFGEGRKLGRGITVFGGSRFGKIKELPGYAQARRATNQLLKQQLQQLQQLPEVPRRMKKLFGGNFNNDPRSPTALNKSQLRQLKELPRSSETPIFDRHSLNLLSNMIQSKQIVEGKGMRIYK